MVKEGEEAKKWQSITHAYMTEESDDSSDPNVIVTHRLPWRSESKSYQECSYLFTQDGQTQQCLHLAHSPECFHTVT